MKNFVKIFEDLNSDEKESIQTLTKMGFTITKGFDSTGHLYKIHLVLPWYCLNIKPEHERHFRPNTQECADITINKAKPKITNKSARFFQDFHPTNWDQTRDIDEALEMLVKFIHMWAKNLADGIFNFNFDLTPQEIENRRIDWNTRDAVNNLW